MRGLVLIAIAGLAGASAQAQQRAPGCNVSVGSVEVNENGELVRPSPSTDQCAAAEDLLEKLQAMDPREFRRIVSRESIPGNVYTSISRYGTFGGPWTPFGVPRSDLPGLKHAVSWLTDTLVIIVSESEDFSGPTTTVVIADLEKSQVCSFPNWPDDSDPRTITVREIQQILSGGLRGDRPVPSCNLKPLAADDPLTPLDPLR